MKRLYYDYQNQLTSLENQTDSAGVISEYTSEYLTNGQKSKETADTMDEDGKKGTHKKLEAANLKNMKILLRDSLVNRCVRNMQI